MAKKRQKKVKPDTTNNMPRAGFIRRLAAMVYDVLVAIAVGMVAALVMSLTLVVLIGNDVLPANGATDPSVAIRESLLYTSLLQVWVALWVIGFFLWFWKNGGQTLGMRAWRLRLFSINDQPPSWGRLVIRMLSSLCGLGTLLVLLDVKHKLALQDRASKMEMLVLTKFANDHKNW
ncbi:RDD family protein [Alteromonas sediminis]|uniref:RDD family protein n=1 Tax=Alteromonas sediminis TaxID=2259342 RepID=A0A3N5Z9C3_9ALTE|nr:RDD family protein [Alteromonas sediminis]RPJ65798.1 RDD family protein [Alteromonas sediminis]